MSIEVKELTKKYGEQEALSNVSFSINKGEIVGFLGPNGAGKSTMMKILTCYIPQSQGNAKVCDIDVTEESIAVRKKVGYLPEHNPLYLEMYVKEYLLFMAGLHNADKSRVKTMIEKVGLLPERHKKLGQLSKGYRQRVGLAAAMLHDPEVLILDEPTTGLDPNQIVEIRNLIKEFGKEKTVMLSTHIMQEVEILCDRVIIIRQGEIVADKPIAELRKLKTQNTVEVEFDLEAKKKDLLQVEGVKYANYIGGNRWEITGKNKTDLRSSIFKFAVQKELVVLEIKQQELGLESIFRELTNK